MAVRKANQIDQWLVFFLHGIVETAERSIQVFKDIIILKQNIERDVLPRFSTRRQRKRSEVNALFVSPSSSEYKSGDQSTRN